MRREDRRDPEKLYNKMTVGELIKNFTNQVIHFKNKNNQHVVCWIVTFVLYELLEGFMEDWQKLKGSPSFNKAYLLTYSKCGLK